MSQRHCPQVFLQRLVLVLALLAEDASQGPYLALQSLEPVFPVLVEDPTHSPYFA